MSNDTGLQTPRGLGTNGHVQTNKFSVKVRDSKASKEPNMRIIKPDREKLIEVKIDDRVNELVDELIDQGFSDAEITARGDELRKKLKAEAAVASTDGSGAVSDAKMSDTQTHQVAARKNKVIEKLRAAFAFYCT